MNLIKKCVSENEIENFKTGEYTEKYNNANTNSPIRKIGFVAHAIGVDELERVAPELQRLSSEERWEMYNRRSVYSVNAPGIPLKIKSKQGVEVEVRFYIINRTAKQLIDDINGSRLHELQSFLSDNVRIAKKDGCSVIGFGGFSSIAANNCRALEIVDGIAVTSGNALTTGLGFGAMLLGAQKCGLDIENADAAVIGGAGNIGQVYGALLAEKVKKVYLIGSKKSGSLKRLIRARQKIYDEIAKSIINIESDNQISGIVSEIAQISGVRKLIENTSVISMRGTVLGNIILEKYNEDPFIFISDNLEDIKKTKLIACCANAAIPFIGNEFVEAGSVVCDIGVPPNCKAELYKRSDIEVMCGGLAKLPNNQILNAGFMNVEDGFAYGCLTETIVMGILGIKENYSFGDISASQVKEITAVAHALGFKLADKYRYSAQF